MPNIMKKIRFQYAILVYEDTNGCEKKFNFEDWVNRVNQLPYDKRTVSVYGVLARLDKIMNKDERDGLMGLRFLRLRDNNLPYKAAIDEEAGDLNIRDDEFIGESLHVLYDTHSRYFMIQLNRFSLGLNVVAGYINHFNRDTEQLVRFRLFHNDLNLQNLRFDRYKSFDIGLANIGALQKTPLSGLLGNILNSVNDANPNTLKITIGVGRKKGASLTNSVIEHAFDDICTYQEFVTRASIKYCEGDREKGDELNLLDCLEESELVMPIVQRRTLDFDDVLAQMKQEYLRKKVKLATMINEA